MGSEIKDLRVWKRNGGKEVRYYVHTVDGREGCHYVTGNHWNEAGSYSGDMTEAEWAEALEIATWDGTVHTVYEDRVNQAKANADVGEPVKRESQSRKNAYAGVCIYCGRSVPARSGELLYIGEGDEYAFQNARFGGFGWQVKCAGGCLSVASGAATGSEESITA